ncbi:MAG: hypothetical protein HKN48_02250 [Flavobacteriaceae bacterium]|nr:hypothetical protein [Flavobacteriaceae bacterium]
MSDYGVFFMLKKFLLLSLMLAGLTTSAQKTIEKGWEAIGIDKIQIISDQVFNIEVIAKPSDYFYVRTEIDGENYENVVVDTSIKNKTLTIATGFTPYFDAANDKLAAHKVISIEMFIEIPENKEFLVSSLLASFKAQGNFKNVYTALFQGNCTLEDFEGNAQLNTRHGNINVSAVNNVKGDAISKRGKVKNTMDTIGIYLVKAQSVNGDISLSKSQ